MLHDGVFVKSPARSCWLVLVIAFFCLLQFQVKQPHNVEGRMVFDTSQLLNTTKIRSKTDRLISITLDKSVNTVTNDRDESRKTTSVDIVQDRAHREIAQTFQMVRDQWQNESEILLLGDKNYSNDFQGPLVSKRFMQFLPRAPQLSKKDVVLAVILSPDKLPNLLLSIKYWKGPASVAVFIKSQEDIDRLEAFVNENLHDALANCSLHILMEVYNPNSKAVPFPHNVLRNMALHSIETDYFLAIDVDHIPSPNSYQLFGSLINNYATGFQKMLQNHTLFVLPAFEIHSRKNIFHSTPEMLPQNKSQLLHLLNKTHPHPRYEARQFHPHFNQGHGPTNYSEWKKDRQVYFYRVEYRCWFEPYVFGYLPGIPPYFEAFRGLGFNKVSWFVELDRAGYQFSVLKDAWVAHLDHPRSSRSPKARWKTHKAAARKFYRHLDRTYPKSKNCNVTLN